MIQKYLSLFVGFVYLALLFQNIVITTAVDHTVGDEEPFGKKTHL